MNANYMKLWKLLLDKNLKRIDLKDIAGISSSTLAKLERMSTFQWTAWLAFVLDLVVIFQMSWNSSVKLNANYCFLSRMVATDA